MKQPRCGRRVWAAILWGLCSSGCALTSGLAPATPPDEAFDAEVRDNAEVSALEVAVPDARDVRFVLRSMSSRRCERSEECDDGLECTHDRCDNTVCSHALVHARCGVGERCALMAGCVPTRACRVDHDCVDQDPCTVNERCEPSSRSCAWETLDGDNDGAVPVSCGGDDCDDDRAECNPHAVERCDGLDNNCDGRVDEREESERFCGPGARCLEANCVCARPDESVCGARCTRLGEDPAHCGGCGHACGPTQRCVQGGCRCVASGLAVCGQACVSLSQDPLHCGRCFTSCGAGGHCREGRCE